MGWVKNWLSGGAGADGGGAHELAPLVQGDSGSVVRVDVSTITHSFIVLSPADLHHSDRAASLIQRLNEHGQPEIWKSLFRIKAVTLTADPIDTGFPAPDSIGAGLEQVGLEWPYSLVVNTMTVTFDRGQSQSKVLVGFSFREKKQRLILPRSDGCRPK